MSPVRFREGSDAWETRIKITPKRNGFSVITRLRDLEREEKKTIYVEHIFVDSNGEVAHYHLKLPAFVEI